MTEFVRVYETRAACEVVCICVLVIEDIRLFVLLCCLLFLLNSGVFHKHPRRCLSSASDFSLLCSIALHGSTHHGMSVLLFADGRVVARFGLFDTRGHSCTPLPEHARWSFSGVVQGPDLPGHMVCQFSVDLGSFFIEA